MEEFAEDMAMDESRQLSRRSALKIFAVLAGAAAVLPGARDALAQGKLSKAQAKYQDQPKGDQRCSNCAQYVAPNQCKVVEGPVSPDGWSALYSPKS